MYLSGLRRPLPLAAGLSFPKAQSLIEDGCKSRHRLSTFIALELVPAPPALAETLLATTLIVKGTELQTLREELVGTSINTGLWMQWEQEAKLMSILSLLGGQ